MLFIILIIFQEFHRYGAHTGDGFRSPKQHQRTPNHGHFANPQNGRKLGDDTREPYPVRFGRQNQGPFLHQNNRNNRPPMPTSIFGTGRSMESDATRDRMMLDASTNRQLQLNNIMAGHALLGAANLRNLEQALHARVQLLGGGLAQQPFAGALAPQGNTLDFAASQLEPVGVFLKARPPHPVPRHDGNLARYASWDNNLGRSSNSGFGNDGAVSTFRPNGEGLSGGPRVMQFPAGNVPIDTKMAPHIGLAKPLRAVVFLTSQFGITGIFNFSQSAVDQPVEIVGRVGGLRPGDHGIHIHSLGDLSRSCDSTGSHYNPEGVLHGSPDDAQYQTHAGDLGNIFAGEYNTADFALSTSLISLYPPSPTLAIGRALVIHEKPDDLGRGSDQQSRENGNSGTRIACGIIGMAN